MSNQANIKDAIKHQEVQGRKLVEKGWGEIKDLQNGSATIIWATTPELKNNGWFKIKSGSRTIILNKHELQYLLRNV